MKSVTIFALCVFLCCICCDLSSAEDVPKFYLSYPKRKTWYEAISACRKLGNNYELATISGELEQQEIEELFKSKKTKANTKKFESFKGQIWIAGTIFPGQEALRWFNFNGNLIVYTNWDVDEPNNSKANEHCVALRNRNGTQLVWNDTECDSKFYYLCRQFDEMDLPVKSL